MVRGMALSLSKKKKRGEEKRASKKGARRKKQEISLIIGKRGRLRKSPA